MKNTIVHKIFKIFIFLWFFCFLFFTILKIEKPTDFQYLQSNSVLLNTEKVFKDFKTNEYTAYKKYENQNFLIKGSIVYTMYKQNEDKIEIFLIPEDLNLDENKDIRIKLEIRTNDPATLKTIRSFKPNQKIQTVCTSVQGILLNILNFKYCVFQN